MRCQCIQLPQIFNIENFSNRLMEYIELVGRKPENWVELYECSICGQHWQIDLIDKLQVNCAIKIDNPGNWTDFDDNPIRFQYLIDSRGGLSENNCLMADCKNKALNSLAFCPKHAFEKLGLRE